MEQVLKYSDVIGPYFFMIFVVFTVACGIWLITELRKSALSRNEWFVKRSSRNRFKKIVTH